MPTTPAANPIIASTKDHRMMPTLTPSVIVRQGANTITNPLLSGYLPIGFPRRGFLLHEGMGLEGLNELPNLFFCGFITS